jgi:hypothetical protein
MSKAPKQIWVWWDDEYDVGVVSKHGDKRYIPDEAREYVCADRIEELERKLAKAQGFVEGFASRALSKEHNADEKWLINKDNLTHMWDCDITQARTTSAELKGEDRG